MVHKSKSKSYSIVYSIGLGFYYILVFAFLSSLSFVDFYFSLDFYFLDVYFVLEDYFFCFGALPSSSRKSN